MRQDWNESPIAGALQTLWTGAIGSTGKKSLRLLDRWLLAASKRLAHRHRLSDADAEDVRARVLLEVVKRAADRSWAESVVNAEAYLFTCLNNAWVSLWRRNQAETRRAERLRVEESARAESAFAGAGVDPDDEELDVEAARRTLQTMLNVCIEEALLAARNDDEREERRRAIEQVLGLHARTRTMEQVLAEEGISPESTKEERVRIRNRLQKRHERARTALRLAAESLEESGQLSADLAQRMRLAVGLLRRCQRSKGAGVDGGGTPA